MDRGVDPISSSGGVGAFVTACSQGKVEIVHTILERMQGRHKQAELCRYGLTAPSEHSQQSIDLHETRDAQEF
jgi:hypothetical protein